MGIRWTTGTIYSLRGVPAVINIYEDGYEDEPGVFIAEQPSFSLEYEGDNSDLYGHPSQASSVTIPMLVEVGNTVLDSWINTVISGQEEKYFVEILIDGDREWIGQMLVDINEIEDSTPYVFNITTVCGLGRLEDFDFDYALSDESPEKPRLGEFLLAALLPCKTEQFYGDEDIFIKSAINIYEIDQQTSNEAMCNTRVSKVAMVSDPEAAEPKSCLEVIEDILRPFGARIAMKNGCWCITTPEVYTQSSFTFYEYTKLDFTTSASSSSFSPRVAVGFTDHVHPIAVNTIPVKPSLIKCDIIFEPASHQLLTEKTYNTSAFYQTINPVTGLNDHEIEISIKLKYQVALQTIGNVLSQAGFTRFTAVIEARTGATAKYRLFYTPTDGFIWTTDVSNNTFVYYDLPKVTDGRAISTADIRIILPQLADTSIDTIYVNFFVGVLGAGCSYDISWGATMEMAQRFDDGEFDTSILYQATNEDYTTSSVNQEDTIVIGDSDNSFVQNALEIYTGSEWKRSEAWAKGTVATSGDPIGLLLAATIVSMQRRPRYQYRGSFDHTGNYTPLHCLTWRSRILFFNSGRFDFGPSIVEGEWIEMQLTTDNVAGNTGTPRLSEVQKLRNEVKRLRAGLQDNTTAIGTVTQGLGSLGSTVTDVKEILKGKQDLLAGYVVEPEGGPTPGDALGVSLVWDGEKWVPKVGG